MTISERIAELREYARQDREECNEGSISDFLAFPVTLLGMEGPYLFLLDNGDLRALWKSVKYRLAVEFLGEGRARLVAWPTKPAEKATSLLFRVTGFPERLTGEEFLSYVKEHEAEEAEIEVVGLPGMTVKGTRHSLT